MTKEFLEMTSEKVILSHIHEGLVDLHIKIHYRPDMQQEDYPDFIQLKTDLEKWSADYNWSPVEGEPPIYRETMVKDISRRILMDYPTINVAEYSVIVHPNAHYTYPHSIKSVATRSEKSEQAIETKESLSLSIKSYGIDHQGPQVIDLQTTIHFEPDLRSSEQPSFKAIYDMLFELMENYPVESDYWETLIKSMSADVLGKYSQLKAIEMSLRVYPTYALPYFHTIYCRSEQ